MNPLAVAVQGLGFGSAMVALQGMLALVIEEIAQMQSAAGGGGLKTRRRARLVPDWLPDLPVENDDALLLAGVL